MKLDSVFELFPILARILYWKRVKRFFSAFNWSSCFHGLHLFSYKYFITPSLFKEFVRDCFSVLNFLKNFISPNSSVWIQFFLSGRVYVCTSSAGILLFAEWHFTEFSVEVLFVSGGRFIYNPKWNVNTHQQFKILT